MQYLLEKSTVFTSPVRQKFQVVLDTWDLEGWNPDVSSGEEKLHDAGSSTDADESSDSLSDSAEATQLKAKKRARIESKETEEA